MDRGVSEIVSFILTFAVITMMIGILYTGGFVTLDRLQTGNQIQNAEGVFLAMDDSFDELQEGQAPKRAGALDLDVGASLTVVNDSRINVSVNGPGYDRSFLTRSLQYRLDDRIVTYETGAVLRTNDGRSVLIGGSPDIFCSPDSNSSVISIVTLSASDGASVASGTATVTGYQRSTTLLYPADRSSPTAVDNVTINVTSPRETAWNRYFEESTGWSDDDGDGTYVCEAADRVYLRHTVVEVDIVA